ncbi:MAG: biotin carboxyl carrier protein [Flavobacteriales bacterium]|jgi:biotin carboxyl carrier protein
MSTFVVADDTAAPVSVKDLGENRFRVVVEGRSYDVVGHRTETGVTLQLGDRVIRANVDHRPNTTVTVIDGKRIDLPLVSARVHALSQVLGDGAGGSSSELVSPMTGKVVHVPVAAGDTIEEGQTLVIIEAMKMENELRAAHDAVVESVTTAMGDLVTPGDLLVRFVKEDE